MREVSRNSPRGSLGSFPLQEDPAETWCASITQTGGITSRFYEISPAEGQNRPMCVYNAHCAPKVRTRDPPGMYLIKQCMYKERESQTRLGATVLNETIKIVNESLHKRSRYLNRIIRWNSRLDI